MKIALGVTDFKELIEFNSTDGDKSVFFDKTLLIRDIVNDPSKFILFTRPRRFGKTLGMNMLKYFFDTEEKIFDNLKISQYPKVIENFHGKIPTISISLKDVIASTYEGLLREFSEVITALYRSYDSILDDRLKNIYSQKVLDEREISSSLLNLSEYLSRYTKKQVLIIIDEYDTPLNDSYVNDYLDSVALLFRKFFSQTFKDNPYLYKGILTGINRIAKESLFSGLNNFKTADIDSDEYTDYFGFTEEEIQSLEIPDQKKAEIKEWYNGYSFGNSTIYNPWSVLSYLTAHFKPNDYWSRTGGMGLVEKNIRIDLVSDLKKLLEGDSINVEIDRGLVYYNLTNRKDSFFSLLYNAGYLTSASDWLDYGETKKLKITNKEIMRTMSKLYIDWFTRQKGTSFLESLIDSLVEGKIMDINEKLETIVLQNFRFYDVTETKQESFYHGFLLGISLVAQTNFEIKSNRESGFGRYDIAWFPKDKEKHPGVIIELKVENSSADEALKQINIKKYESELLSYGCKKIMAYGIHCDGKNIKVKLKE